MRVVRLDELTTELEKMKAELPETCNSVATQNFIRTSLDAFIKFATILAIDIDIEDKSDERK